MWAGTVRSATASVLGAPQAEYTRTLLAAVPAVGSLTTA